MTEENARIAVDAIATATATALRVQEHELVLVHVSCALLHRELREALRYRESLTDELISFSFFLSPMCKEEPVLLAVRDPGIPSAVREDVNGDESMRAIEGLQSVMGELWPRCCCGKRAGRLQ
jgi:hypothetical protein